MFDHEIRITGSMRDNVLKMWSIVLAEDQQNSSPKHVKDFALYFPDGIPFATRIYAEARAIEFSRHWRVNFTVVAERSVL